MAIGDINYKEKIPSGIYESAANSRKRSTKELPLSASPNVLHKFASYNSLFTLSTLSLLEIRNPKNFFQGKPHDIIAQSGGIGPDANKFSGPPSAFANRFSEESKKTIQKSEQIQKGLDAAGREFLKNNDLYFRNVELKSIPGYNEQARLTSVTNIKIELVEPAGITLLEKLRAAAANNGFLDHLDAPYMLTIEFKGFDENGQPIKEKNEFIKRVIPIKITNVDIDVNQGGSYYTMTAIPYNEFGLVNNFMYPRTSGTLSSIARTFADAVVSLQNVLNDQNKQEQQGKFNQFPDQYDISISEDLDPQQQLSYDLLSQAGMTQKVPDPLPGDETFDLDMIKFTPSTNIPMLLENLMKTHPKFGAKSFEEWSEAVSKKGTDKFNPNEALSTYFKYFRIKTSVEPTKNFDEIRQTQAKIIKVVVEPYYISAYNLATAGVHQDKKFQSYVAKEYNFIFTGDNVDILNLDINYKVAYFQARLKDLEANDAREFSKSKDPISEDTGTPTNRDRAMGGQLPLHSDTTVSKSSGAGKTGKSDARLEQFFDYLTNPRADMVLITMQILGDPAWLGQSQFIPATPTNSNGSSTDNNIDFFRGGKSTNIWNPDLKCFNYDVAEPVLNLTFKTPQDFNDKTGIYELSSSPQGVFSGLYKVVQIDNSFTDGQFTQTLTMVRFNNQDQGVTKTSNEKISKKDGVITNVRNPNQMARDRENITYTNRVT